MSTPQLKQLAEFHQEKLLAPPTDLGLGIHALTIPLTGSPLRSVFMYAVETSAGLVLIDAAYDHRTCWQALTEALTHIGHQITDVIAVLLTHNHPDHIGLAPRIREASGAELVMHVRDDFGRQRQERGRFLEQLRTVLLETGAPGDVREEMYVAATKVAIHREDLVVQRVLTKPETDLVFGDVTIRAVHTPGHTVGHTAYRHPAGVLFTGDTLMPEGSTQLALAPRPSDDPTGDVLATLERISGLDVELVCPAHQYPFTDADGRCRELLELHSGEARRARSVADGLADAPADAWHVAPSLSWAKPWDAMGINTKRFALVHTHSLLKHRPEGQS